MLIYPPSVQYEFIQNEQLSLLIFLNNPYTKLLALFQATLGQRFDCLVEVHEKIGWFAKEYFFLWNKNPIVLGDILRIEKNMNTQ